MPVPIDIQCPDCEHVFPVPSSMAGKRTLCRSCNAALIVPDDRADIPDEAAPLPDVKRKTPAEEKSPNWDTPIPFQSPGPIIAVLLVALAASVVVLGVYGVAHDGSIVAKPTSGKPYRVAPEAPEPVKPESTPDPRATTGYDREVILPDQEVIVPKYGRDSKMAGSDLLPRNWWIVRGATNSGAVFHLHDSSRGHIAASVPESRNRIADKGVTASTSGRWLAQASDSFLDLYSCASPNEAVLKWEPYSEKGRPSRKLAACTLLSDDRLLTVSDDGSFDLWAIPGGDYIRRVAVLPASRNRAGFGCDVAYERSLLAIRDGSKLEVYSLEDDTSGALVGFAAALPSKESPKSRVRFTPDGKRVVTASAVDSPSGTLDDRVEVFDIASKARIAEWTIPSNRRDSDPWSWSVGAEELLVYRRDLGLVSDYRWSDGKLRSAIELGEARNTVALDASGRRVCVLESSTAPARFYGFDLPLRNPAVLQKNPVWEYKAGVLELKKAAR